MNVKFSQQRSKIPSVVAIPLGTSTDTVIPLKISGISTSGFTIIAGIIMSGDSKITAPAYDLRVCWIAIEK